MMTGGSRRGVVAMVARVTRAVVVIMTLMHVHHETAHLSAGHGRGNAVQDERESRQQDHYGGQSTETTLEGSHEYHVATNGSSLQYCQCGAAAIKRYRAPESRHDFTLLARSADAATHAFSPSRPR